MPVGARLLCKQTVEGSIPSMSTKVYCEYVRQTPEGS